MPPGFYNPYDQQVYDAGFKYIPQSKYLLNPFQIPTDDSTTTPPDTGGITSLNRGGGGGFNPYNTDMSEVRQDYNAFPSRQAGEIYSKTFNPQSPFSIKDAQQAYNMATDGINRGFGDLIAKDNPDLKFYRGDKSVFQMQKDADDLIQDAKMRYATEGQYVDPYDPRYSSVTEAQKFMDNYPEYYGVPSGVPEPGIPGAIKSYMQNSLLGRGLNALKGLMPINERAIMENEARGAGIFTDDIGRIVTDDYNTAGGIMAGYNLNKIDAGTFDKRRGTIEKTIADKKAKGLDTTTLEERLGLLDEAEEEILGARKKTKQIYKMRKDKKAADKKRKEEEKAAAAAAAAKAAAERELKQRMTNIGNVTAAQQAQANKDYQRVQRAYREDTGGQGGSYATGESGVQSDGSYNDPFDPGGGEKDGGFIDGTNRRMYYMDGGLADMLEIYDWL